MKENKSITFDKEAQAALPADIRARMDADRDAAMAKKLCLSNYMYGLYKVLLANGWKEPTEKDLPTYIEAYRRHGTKARGPYFEDAHYVWRHHKPVTVEP